MGFTRDTTRTSAQQAIYDVIKAGFAAMWLIWGRESLSSLAVSYLGMSVRAGLAWGVVAAIVLAFVSFFFYEWWRSRESGQIAPAWEGFEPNKKKHRKKYRNMEVRVDGQSFDYCRFDNVTLRYFGVRGTMFNECQFHGSLIVATDHPAVTGYLSLTEALKQLPGIKFRVMKISKEDGTMSPIDPPIIKTGQAPY
jgi:hypothetical protein